jgi:phosphatidylinositol glycan class B
VDHWGYGDWSLSPWNYVRYNLLRGEVNRYGRTPWWDLYRMSITESWPLLGILLALCIPLAWILRPLSVLTWSQLPFFLVHEWIPHKELRFFFPLVWAAPISLAFFYESVLRKPSLARTVRALAYVLVPLNCLALAVFCFLPLARNVQFQEALYAYHPTTLWIHERDPFENLGTQTYFYRPPGLTLHKMKDWSELQAQVEKNPLLFFDTRLNFPEEGLAAEPRLGQECKPVYRTLPDWIEKLNFGNWLIRVNTWTLFECRANGQ